LYCLPNRGLVFSGSFDTSVLCWLVAERRCVEELRGNHRDAVRSVVAVRDDSSGKEALWTGGDDKDAAFCVYEMVSSSVAP
jgi:hypothetical protein